MSDFTDQVAMISGATGAMGGAIARRLATAGARLVLLGRDRAKLESLQAELPAAVVLAGDLTTEESVLEACQAVLDGPGRLDILVHGLGLFLAGELGVADVADLDLMFAVNVRAPYRLTQALLPSLRESEGQIVFLNSNAGLEARATVSAYSASKHALKALADGLRAEVNDDGIRVLSVFPGRTASEMQRRVCEHFGQAYEPDRLMTSDDVAVSVVNALALPRSVEMTELRMRPMRK